MLPVANDLTTPEIFGELASITRYLLKCAGVRAERDANEALDLLRVLAGRQSDCCCDYSREKEAACLDAMKEKP